jgi:hypothetical protein
MLVAKVLAQAWERQHVVAERRQSAGRAPRADRAETGARARLRAAWTRPAVRHLVILAGYLAAGIAVTWPRAAYLVEGRLPNYGDVVSYVWDLWWVTHQTAHLGNPFFTSHMAAPAGVQLGFDTLIPLLGVVMTPVTLTFGPSASLSLLTIAVPGLACYAMYRVGRLWLRTEAGAIAAGACFGLSSMLDWQDWYHLQISAGVVFLPLTLEAAVRLRRRPGLRQGLILGLVLGAAVLVNQETAVMAGILAALALVPWLLRAPRLAPARLGPLALGALAAAVVASPQLIAMAQQARRAAPRSARTCSRSATRATEPRWAGCSPRRPGWLASACGRPRPSAPPARACRDSAC